MSSSPTWGLTGPKPGSGLAIAPSAVDLGDLELAEDAGLAADGDGDAGLDLVGHEHVEGDESAVLGVLDVFLHAADEQGLADHAGAAEFAVLAFEFALFDAGLPRPGRPSCRVFPLP